MRIEFPFLVVFLASVQALDIFPRGIHLSWQRSNETATSITIGWNTNDVADTKAFLGLFPNEYTLTATGTAATRYHVVEFRGLTPQKEYHFRVGNVDGGTWAPDTKFTSPREAPGGIIRFAALADSRTGITERRQVFDIVRRMHPQFVVFAGDLVDSASSSLFVAWLDDAQPFASSAPTMACMGNHEGGTALWNTFFKFPFLNRYYDFDVGHVHFTFLDYESEAANDPTQLAFLSNSMAARQGPTTWRFLDMHTPIFSSSTRVYTGIQSQIVRSSHIDVTFSGHDHFYEHLKDNASDYVIAGSAGAPLRTVGTLLPISVFYKSTQHACIVEVTQNQFYLRTVELPGNTIDRFAIRRFSGADLRIENPLDEQSVTVDSLVTYDIKVINVGDQSSIVSSGWYQIDGEPQVNFSVPLLTPFQQATIAVGWMPTKFCSMKFVLPNFGQLIPPFRVGVFKLSVHLSTSDAVPEDDDWSMNFVVTDPARLITIGDKWQYFDQSAVPVSTWFNPATLLADWSIGASPFGTFDQIGRSGTPLWTTTQSSHQFRISFVPAGAFQTRDALVTCEATGAVTLYHNGALLTTFAAGNNSVIIPHDSLVFGSSNTIAVTMTKSPSMRFLLEASIAVSSSSKPMPSIFTSSSKVESAHQSPSEFFVAQASQTGVIFGACFLFLSLNLFL